MRKIIIDTDPGTDDAVALLTAKAYGLDIDTVISTYGNVSHGYTHKNLVNLNGLLEINANVISGADKPIEGDCFTADYVHGKNGVGGVVLPDYHDNAACGDGTKLLYERIKQCKSVDYISLGPLTNLALLITRFPDAEKHINSLTIMGGGFSVHNIPHNAEYNIGCDPAAAKIVFSSNLNITLVPLDVTHKICLSSEEVGAITENFTCGAGKMLADIMMYNYKTSVLKNDGGALIHDATAVMAYANPEKFSGIKTAVSVDGHGATSRSGDGDVFVIFDADRAFVVDRLKKSYEILR